MLKYMYISNSISNVWSNFNIVASNILVFFVLYVGPELNEILKLGLFESGADNGLCSYRVNVWVRTRPDASFNLADGFMCIWAR
ncbi:hypothetical protein HanIR_Chr15g0733681 [Helianthus annuus]|nr:hypothetical protein HanIR_Chr15g0733681 [Helianthus annuus]